MKFDILLAIAETLEERKQADPDKSYTAKLFHDGLDSILKKIGEEATEFVIAGKNNNYDEICEEGADLMFHLLVFLHSQGMTLSDITQVLARRAGHTDSEN